MGTNYSSFVKVLEYIETSEDLLNLLIVHKSLSSFLQNLPNKYNNVIFTLSERLQLTEIVFSGKEENKKKGSDKKDWIDEKWSREEAVRRMNGLDGSMKGGDSFNNILIIGKVINTMISDFSVKKCKEKYMFPNIMKDFVYSMTLSKNSLILNPFEIFPNLECLKINVFNLKYLRKDFDLKKLKKLIIFSGYIDSKSILPDLSKFNIDKLKELEFYSISSLRDNSHTIDCFKDSLEHLKIAGPPMKFQNLAPMLFRGIELKNLNHLKSLELVYCKYIKDMNLKLLSKTLEKLIVISCLNIRGKFIKSLVNLNYLFLIRLPLFNHDVVINELGLLEKLRYFNIWDCDNVLREDINNFLKQNEKCDVIFNKKRISINNK